MRATMDDVRHAYRLFLGREPDEHGLESHARLVESGIETTDLARGFFGTREFIATTGCLVKVERGEPPHAINRLHCQACTRHQIESAEFLYWAGRLGERPGGLHRKVWEWCFITQALWERGKLGPSSRGLGFAVGVEPLTPMFANLGCDILATDLDHESAAQAGWVASNQHADGAEQLNLRGLCSPEDFTRHVRFRNVDMNHIQKDLRGFDFLWSSCALEHLGSLAHGMDFVVNAMDCLAPGGVAVHTTEINCDSDEHTIETGGSVIYRKRDLLALADRLRGFGYEVEPMDFHLGDTAADAHIDDAPYTTTHLKLRIGPYASTSFGLIVTRPRAKS